MNCPALRESVLVFTGWLGSGKSHAARLLASAFPVQANVHTLGTSVPDPDP